MGVQIKNDSDYPVNPLCHGEATEEGSWRAEKEGFSKKKNSRKSFLTSRTRGRTGDLVGTLPKKN